MNRNTLFLLLTFILNFFTAKTALADGLNSRVENVLGRSALHDGPNCYNAVSYAKEFTDLLTQTSSMELKYFLLNLCSEIQTMPKKGDVSVVIRGGVYEHAAVVWDDKTNFEKGGLGGLYGRFDDRRDSSEYRLTSPHESRYFIQCERNCEVRHYRCENTVQSKERLIGACKKSEVFKGLETIKGMLMYTAFTRDLGAKGEIDMMMKLVNEESKKMDAIRESDPCALYYLTSWNSIVSHLGSLQSEIFDPSLRMLYGASMPNIDFKVEYVGRYKNFSYRLKSHLKDAKNREILREFEL